MSKTILITGTSTGFGRDTAETLAAEGHTVFASMRDPARRNSIYADGLRAKGIEVLELDVTDSASVDAAVGAVIGKTGRIDVLVNNAGIASSGISEAFTVEQTQALFDVNVFGTLRTIRAVLPAMRAQRQGLIINLSSIVGRLTFPFMGLYGASKFAIEALTDSYRFELSQLGVEFVLVQPSAYPTNIFSSIQRPSDTARIADYGETAQVPAQIGQTLGSLFQGPNPPNPHDVAVAIAALVDAERGTRPDRVVVGQAFGADVVNQQTAPVQQQVLEGLGLGKLSTLAH